MGNKGFIYLIWKLIEKIMLSKVLACFFLLIFVVFAAAEEDSFFCRNKKDNWQICRTCNDTSLDCDGVSNNECKCAGIQIAKKDSYEGYGGIDHCKKEGWCYVTLNGACSDQEWDADNERFTTDPDQSGTSYIWLKKSTEFARSKEACQSEMQHNIGNEEMMQDTKIATDFLMNGTIDDNGIEYLESTVFFEAESPEKCKQDCEEKQQCGAWSYDKVYSLCYLHTVESCCGQFTKREPEPGFVPGYVCKACWSTRGECPCSVGERLTKTGTAHSSGSGGKPPIHLTSTGVGFVTQGPVNVDVCKCIEKPPTKTRRRWRCVKPVCKDPEINPDGICEGERRCRKKPRKSEDES